MRLAMSPEQHVVENEPRGERLSPLAGRGKPRGVLDPKIAPVPVNYPHCSLLPSGPRGFTIPVGPGPHLTRGPSHAAFGSFTALCVI